MPRFHRPSAPRVRPASVRLAARHAGFTLIEVMVALIVLVLGVLGSAAMTLTAIRDGKQSGLRSQAAALAYELGDLMRTTRSTSSDATEQAAREAIFTSAAPATNVPACWTNGCTPAEMARNDYYEWHQKLIGANGLPNGQAVICRDSTKLADTDYPACDNAPTSPLVVKLRWDEKNNNARDAAVTTSTTSAPVLPASVSVRTMVVPIQPY